MVKIIIIGGIHQNQQKNETTEKDKSGRNLSAPQHVAGAMTRSTLRYLTSQPTHEEELIVRNFAIKNVPR